MEKNKPTAIKEGESIDNPKITRAWCFYDWANSSFPLVNSTALFPMFYDAKIYHFTKNIDDNEVKMLEFWGREVVASALYSYVQAFMFFMVALLLPFFSGIADYSVLKKSKILDMPKSRYILYQRTL